MAGGKSLRNKIDGVLKRMNATSRVVKFRTRTASGGDPILGIAESSSYSEVEVNPQPAVTVADSGLVKTSNGVYQLGDYLFTFSGNIPEETFSDVTILYGAEELKIIQYNPYAMSGIVVAWEVLARASKAG